MKKISISIIFLILCVLSLKAQIWEGNYYIRTQEDANNFRNNCKCTEINGNLYIYGSSINNLNGLSDLYEVHGWLQIRNTNLNNLNGLSNVRSIGSNFEITRNYGLKNINALSKLKTIGGNVTISRNDGLTNLNGLANLESTTLDNIYIYNNDQLNDINVFNQVENLRGYLTIAYNDQLKKIMGFTNLRATNSHFEILRNQITNLNAFENLTTVGGKLNIKDNSLLKVINLPNLKEVHLLSIWNNSQLNEISLPNVTTIDGSLEIGQNFELVTLDGFNSVNLINGALSIRQNYALTNIEGLQNISHVENNLTIIENPSLSSCCIVSCKIRDRVMKGGIHIKDNGSGCSSATDLYLGCDQFCLLSSIDTNSESTISIFPSPAIDYLNVDLLDKLSFDYLIYDTAGQLAASGQIFESKIRVAYLPKGLYILHLSHHKKDIVTKFLKE